MSMKETPLAKVKRLHSSKENLVGTLVPAIAGADEDKDVLRERLLTASNAKLLHLADVVEAVKKEYGSKDKLVTAIAAVQGKSKDKDYQAKLATYSLPKLHDLATSAKRRAARA